jgi:Na+/H+-dicarboxylate symporter
MSATARVLTGLAAGIVLGIVLAWTDPVLAGTVAGIVEPFGKLWINALQMTVVPLVLSLVIIGVNQATDVAQSGRVARRAIVIFLVLLTAAAVMTAVLAPLALSMLQPDPAVAAALRGHEAELPPVTGGWASALTAIVPSNAVAAAAAGAMLPLVTFALFFGFALTRIEPARRAQVVGFFQAVSDAMIVVVRWVLWVAPVGIFALVLALTARSGIGMLQALGIYILLECALYLLATVLLIAIAVTAGRQRLGHFLAGIAPVQAVAASTQSSLATLPAMIDCTRNKLGYPTGVTALVLPMAVSLFRITSPIQYMGVAAFIAWTYGIDLSMQQVAVGATLAVVISIGSVGLPGQASFMGTNLPVVQAMGLPIEPLGLLLAVDLVPDIFATLGNATADMTVTSVLAQRHGPPDGVAPTD